MSSQKTRKKRLALRHIALSLFAVSSALTLIMPNVAHAANAEPSSADMYNYLQLARSNTFRVYAKPGEVIHFKVGMGYLIGTAGSDVNLCADIGIYDSTSSSTPIADDGNLRIYWVHQNGDQYRDTTFTNGATHLTCTGTAYNPLKWLVISYQVPESKSMASIDDAYYLKFIPRNTTDDKTRSRDDKNTVGYKWQVSVNDTLPDYTGLRRTGTSMMPDTKPTHFGRTWVEGDNTGLQVWQLDRNSSGNSEPQLTTYTTNHTFVFARKDGYKYTANYFDYHGIWSVIHGGVYGIRSKASSLSAHTSYPDSGSTANPYFRYTVNTSLAGQLNLAYIFVDCAPANNTNDSRLPRLTNGEVSCPSGLNAYDAYTHGASKGYNIIRDLPMTRSGNVKDGNNTYTSSPIADANISGDPKTDYNFRYVDYTATNLALGKVYVPYYGMQSGSIQIEVYRRAINAKPTDPSELMCRVLKTIDDPSGTGDKYWEWISAKDSNCIDGTLKDNVVTNVPATDKLIITAKAVRLGEMHFVEHDTEERGGITVTSNNAAKSTGLAWYDPFSRLTSDTCGRIPPRIGNGAPVSGLSSGSLDDDTTWDSMSSDSPSLSRINLYNSTTYRAALGDADRSMVNSDVPGGVHGWTSASTCDAAGNANDDGNASFNGTATQYSTWGNNRSIDDWTYDDAASKVLSITIGGPSYNLVPSVAISPKPVILGQSVVASPAIQNTGTSSSDATHWELREIILDPGVTISQTARDGTNLNEFDCTYYMSLGAKSCSDVNVAATNSVTVTNGKTLSLTQYTENNTGALKVGSSVCFALVITPYDQTGGNYRGIVNCSVVAAAPYVSVIGGAVWSGGSITFPSLNADGKIEASSSYAAGFGSYGEYDVFATGTIDHFGSAGRPGQGMTIVGAQDGARLTFGSLNSPLGVFSSHSISDWKSLCSSLDPNPANINSDLTLNPGQTLKYCNERVNIRGNITYNTSGVSSFGQVPSLTIVANEIYIYDSVSRVAGNFYAVNRFVTCAAGPVTVGDKADVVVNGKMKQITTSGKCSQNSLTINGSVTVANQAAGSLVLNRSYGGTAVGEPAETIRFRPESFLTSFENSLQLMPVYETELPARY